MEIITLLLIIFLSIPITLNGYNSNCKVKDGKNIYNRTIIAFYLLILVRLFFVVETALHQGLCIKI